MSDEVISVLSTNFARMISVQEETNRLLAELLATLSGTSPPPLKLKPLHYDAYTFEAEFLKMVGEVYLNEGELVKQKGGGKKSSRRVANQFAELYPAFFTSRLTGITITTAERGLLIFRRNQESICALKIYTDLGYHRGDKWYKDMSEFMKIASRKDVPNHRVFFLVISFQNSLDNAHVQKLLGSKITNKALLENRNRAQLEKYASSWVVGSPLPNAEEQCYFLASKLHPNRVHEFLQADLSSYEWMKPSISELIVKIQHL